MNSDFYQFVIFVSKFPHINNVFLHLNGYDFIHFQAAEKKPASTETKAEENKDEENKDEKNKDKTKKDEENKDETNKDEKKEDETNKDATAVKQVCWDLLWIH